MTEANRIYGDADLVVLDHVRKSFGAKTVLKDISFVVPSGQICGLLGSNGAGKRILFRLLMGIMKATEGNLTVDGWMHLRTVSQRND